MTIEVIEGTVNNDNLTGMSFLDFIFGLEGNDTLTGGKNLFNWLDGGLGNDIVHGGGLLDVLKGGAGIDTLSYSEARSAVTVSLAKTGLQLTGGGGLDIISGFENVIGSNYNDNLTGNALDNRLVGGLGKDTMTGGAGNDIYSIDNVGDKVVEKANEGTDIVLASVDWQLADNFENLSLFNGAIKGTGNSVDNIIRGTDGNNVLRGAGGHDSIYGGLGADTFILDGPDANSWDYVRDFVSGTDKLQIKGSDFGLAAGSVGSDYFVRSTTGGVTKDGTNNLSTTADHGQFVLDRYNNLYWDADGSGAGKAVQLVGFGTSTFDVTDFVVI